MGTEVQVAEGRQLKLSCGECWGEEHMALGIQATYPTSRASLDGGESKAAKL